MAQSPRPIRLSAAGDAVARGARFRAARAVRGLSQAELGRRVGTTQTAIWRIERGVTARSKYDTLIMFELGIPLDPKTERWIIASRRRKAAAAGGSPA